MVSSSGPFVHSSDRFIWIQFIRCLLNLKVTHSSPSSRWRRKALHLMRLMPRITEIHATPATTGRQIGFTIAFYQAESRTAFFTFLPSAHTFHSLSASSSSSSSTSILYPPLTLKSLCSPVECRHLNVNICRDPSGSPPRHWPCIRRGAPMTVPFRPKDSSQETPPSPCSVISHTRSTARGNSHHTGSTRRSPLPVTFHLQATECVNCD